ncbi:MAG: cytochrome P450 [Ilumatobacteraceae bacterium]
MTSLVDGPTDGEARARAAGCPIVDLDYSAERPVGHHMQRLEQLREEGPLLWNRNGAYWVATRASLIREIFQAPTVFNNDSISPGDPDPVYKWIPSNVNPPQHVQYRQILNRAFGPAAVARAEPTTRQYAREAIEAIRDRGHADLMSEFASLYPTRVFLEAVDLPWEEAPMFTTWADTIFDGLIGNSGATVEAALDAMRSIREYFIVAMEDRRARPRDPADDFLTHVMGSTIDDEPIPDDDVLNIFNQLVIAGLDTVKTTLGYSFLHLATHAGDRRRLVDDPAVIPNAVEELMRAYGFIMEGRKLGEDIDFHGCPMKRGDMVMLMLPAAMRDPEAYDHAGEVDFDRANVTHLAFGGGPHRCLGSHLARMELQVGMSEWHAAIPDYELDGEIGEVRERGGQLTVRSLPLRWPPS